MGAKAPGSNPRPNKPHNLTASPLPTLHLHTNPMFPQLGFPSNSLQQTQLPYLPFPPPEMGNLSFPQKGLKIGCPRNFLEVQVPLLSAPTTDSGQGSG